MVIPEGPPDRGTTGSSLDAPASPLFFVMVATCIALGAGSQFMAFHKSVSTALGVLTKLEQARSSFYS